MTLELTRRQKYEAHLKSPLWQTQRQGAFSRWGRFCGCCGLNNAVHVHHLNYRNLVDCTDEDLMPLCGVCHDKLHLIPELDRLSREFGDAMEKRRIVIARINGGISLPMVSSHASPRDKKWARQQAKREARRLRKQLREERSILKEQLRVDRLQKEVAVLNARKEKVDKSAEHGRRILANRFQCDEARFADWSHEQIRAVIHGLCVPIFARPRLAGEIAACNPEEMMTLTRKDVEALRTSKGAFTKRTVEALGLEWNALRAGWVDRLVGSSMPRVQYLKARSGAEVLAKGARLLAA